jgi:5-methylcytosine-specific restriction endonuclease McrA
MNLPGRQANNLQTRLRRTFRHHQARAKAAGQILDYTIDDLRRLIESSPCCRWCRLPVAFDLQLDHLHPTSRGGLWTLDNLCVSCARCNQLRGQLTEAETVALRAFLEGLHPAARADLERRLTGGGAVYARGRKAAPASPAKASDRVALAAAEAEVLRAKLERKDR